MTLYNKEKPFKILSIDGGGVKGIYPAKYLAEIEDQLRRDGKDITELNRYFDLICGTSTGGIIALGLALGMKASEILDLYRNKIPNIFSKKKNCFHSIFAPFYSSNPLKDEIIKSFSGITSGDTTRLGHSKTRVCIPVFKAFTGKVSVYKTSHHPELKRDYQIPAHDVALSTAAAPVYFKPHSFHYEKVGLNDNESVTNNMDGGIFANNPTLIGLVEAVNCLEVPLNKIKILSIGTGSRPYKEVNKNMNWGLFYWGNKMRLLDLMFTAQSDSISNLIKLFNQGIGTTGQNSFVYERIQFRLSQSESLNIDETDENKLNNLIEKASNAFQDTGGKIINEFCKDEITPYTPFYKLKK